jgi:isoamylase
VLRQYSRRVASWDPSSPRRHSTDWDPLGVTPDGRGGANVALWAAGASEVQLCLFDEEGREHQVPLRERVFNIFHDHIPDMPVGTRYGFRVSGPWDPHQGLRWNSHKLLLDPYARAIDGDFVLHPAVFGHLGSDDTAMDTRDSAPYVPRGVVVDSAFDWGDDRPPETAWSDTIIYETHVRGISITHPNVPQQLRGTYAGLAHPAIIDHFLDLGVTAVELLPVHQFIDEVHLIERGLSNYWGYNSIGFFAPHADYSSSGSTGEQVAEFKTMVKTLHAAGLEVILDVVYNHTAEGNERGPTLSFRGIDNDDYYRLEHDRRFYTDYTGCGNTLNAARPHVLQVIMDSLRYWVTEMHVDGFRFDLASALARSFHDVDMLSSFLSTISQDPVLRRVKLIAEPWDVGPGGYQVGEFPPLWTEWNDKYRDCVRDFWRGACGIGELGWRLTGSADLYASEGRQPFASINYVTAHDGFTLNDLVSYDHKHNEANLEGNRDGTDDNRSWNCGHEGPTQDAAINELRHKQRRNFLSMMLLSTGVPMLCGGDEFGRTQRGNNNAYCQDNVISWYDWDHDPWQQELMRFTKELIALRKDHPALRQRTFFAGRPVYEGGPKDVDWLGPDGQELSEAAWSDPGTRTLGMYLNGQPDASFLIVFHAGPEPCAFTMPGPSHGYGYDVLLESAGTAPRPRLPSGGVLHVAPFSSVILQVATAPPDQVTAH